MTPTELARVPWQVTGNHWIALPCVHPADGAVHAVGVLHRGARSAVEFAGGPDFLSGNAPPLLRPVITVNGTPRALVSEGVVWERALHWLPTFTAKIDQLIVRGTVFAPYGRDADIAGFAYAIAIENRSGEAAGVTLALDGTLGHRQVRVRTAAPFDDAHRAVEVEPGVVILEGSALPGLISLAVASDEIADVKLGEPGSGRFTLSRRLEVPAGGRVDVAFYVAAGPERDGARATVAVMRRRGWRDLLAVTRAALQSLELSSGHEPIDSLINRHVLFSYFYSVGRALDDAHYYLVRSRVPWSPIGVTVRDWEALCWTLPVIQLADIGLARELLLRMCEVHGYAPGRGVHYFDGTLFEPGFTLEGAAAYAVAVDRYIRDSEDDQIVEEHAIADALYASSDDIAQRRDAAHPLYTTEVTPSGRPAALPFTLHGNAMVAAALDVLRRTLDEETAKNVEDPAAVRAALRRHFVTDADGKGTFAHAVDLKGRTILEDEAEASALWLPMWDAVERTDSVYRRTAKRIGAPRAHLAQETARVIGPDGISALDWLRRAPLDLGFAASAVDTDGRGVGGGGDAALSGLVAYAAWYAVHVAGVR
ncbi:MAG TPA: glycoside hydrolase family 125 protein [Gemmatimonadaceae bacterium]|nr:glycoside hydrolase family 125 protein [Gemmatimonadaceae bacterium]